MQKILVKAFVDFGPEFWQTFDARRAHEKAAPLEAAFNAMVPAISY